MTPGVVLQGTGGIWQVRTDDGVTRAASIEGRVKHDGGAKLAVGDRVMLRESPGDSWTIAEMLPRRSQLVRRAPGGMHGERVVVANVDDVVVVFAASKPEPHVRMLDRFLVIAEANELRSLVVVNKVEIADERAMHAMFDVYATLGYSLYFTSCKARRGIDALHDALRGQVSVLTGPSGVGKSSLMNAMYPTLNLRVGEISESVNKGRHTTVGAFMHPLPDGGFVVDTPGLREIGLWGLPSRTLDRCFPEMRDRRDECRFGDCRHVAEPDCAIREALAAGQINPERYASYQTLLAEATEVERSAY